MRKYYLIINPKSGSQKGQSILNDVKPLFLDAGIDIEADISTHKNHPFELANSRNLDGFDAVCVAGGDGTFHEVINGILKRADGKRLPIGFIPAGTGNSLMHDLDALNPKKAVENILANRRGKLDIMEIETEEETLYSFNILGWGMPSSINLLAERLRWLGGFRYDVASVLELIKNEAKPVKIQIDSQLIEEEVSFFLACNTKFTGNGMKMAPMAEFDDGYVDVFVVRKASRLKLLSLFTKVFKGTHVGDSVIEHFRARSFSIESGSKDPLNIDGQNVGVTPCQISLMNYQLDIFI